MTEQAALLAVIAQQPECDVPRLVFADWLDEQPSSGTMTCPKCRGDRGRGEREYKEFGGEEWKWRQCPTCKGEAVVANTANHDRAEFIRAQIRLATPPWNSRDLIRSEQLLDRHRAEWSRLRCPECGGENLRANPQTCPVCHGTYNLFDEIESREKWRNTKPRAVTFARGFVESVSCTLGEVVTPNRKATEWAKAAVRVSPVVKFVATDVEAWQGRSGTWYAISPDIRRCPVRRDLWHEIYSGGGYSTEESAKDALCVVLGDFVRAEVYEKAVWT